MQRMHGWVSRKDRYPVEIEAEVQRDDGSRQQVKVSDITEEGCRIECDCDFLIGEHVQITIPRMTPIRAQVRWSLPGNAGARFLGDAHF